jgi:acetylglutamate kinase
MLLDAGYMPVIAPVAVSEKGQVLNVDADRAAAMFASALKAESVASSSPMDESKIQFQMRWLVMEQ